VLDEVAEVVGEPGIWSKDEGCSGLEEAFQVEMVLPLVFLARFILQWSPFMVHLDQIVRVYVL